MFFSSSSNFRHLQCGTRMRKTVVPSDSGYLTNEGSEKTMGDVNKFMLICFVSVYISSIIRMILL